MRTMTPVWRAHDVRVHDQRHDAGTWRNRHKSVRTDQASGRYTPTPYDAGSASNLPYTRLQREASTEIRRARSRACGEDQRTNRGQ